MAHQNLTRTQLIETLAQLPDDQLEKVFDFIDELRRQSLIENEDRISPDPVDDPLLRYLGKVDHGTLTRDIDKALYDSAQ